MPDAGAAPPRASTVTRTATAAARPLAIGSPAVIATFTIVGADVVVDARTALRSAAGEPITTPQPAALHGAESAGLAVVVHGHARLDGGVRAQRVDVTAGGAAAAAAR